MPYLGIFEDEEVVPPEVDNGATVVCPACDDNMSVIPSYERGPSFVSRHFRHQGSSKCPGESDTHLKWKAIAYSKLKNRHPDATLTYEGTVGDRRTDVLVEFPSPDDSGLGKGICVEVQYKNESKDIETVTENFLDHGYSVLWLAEDQFEGEDIGQNDVNLEEGTLIKWWLDRIPDVDEWPGYHECLTSIDETAAPSVSAEISLSLDSWGTVVALGLPDAWLEGVKKRDGDSVPIRYPCVGCHELVTLFAPTTYSNNTSSGKENSTFSVEFAASGSCPKCGEQNNLKRRCIRMKSKFIQTDGDPPDPGIPNADTKVHFPCLHCGSAVQSEARARAGSGMDYDSLTLKLEANIVCDECGSIIELAYPREARILSSKK